MFERGRDAGNYANAYTSDDLDLFDLRSLSEGLEPQEVGPMAAFESVGARRVWSLAWRYGFVVGFFSSYEDHEVSEAHMDKLYDARLYERALVRRERLRDQAMQVVMEGHYSRDMCDGEDCGRFKLRLGGAVVMRAGPYRGDGGSRVSLSMRATNKKWRGMNTGGWDVDAAIYCPRVLKAFEEKEAEWALWSWSQHNVVSGRWQGDHPNVANTPKSSV